MKSFRKSIKVPAPGFGTWQLNDDEAYQGVKHALSIGYRHIDTAQMYANEAEVGKAIRDSDVNRHDVFLTTKISFKNLAPRKARESFHESLSRLNLDHTDLVLIHWPSPDGIPLEDTLEAMMRWVEEGKTRYIGVSNFPPSLLKKAMDLAPILTNQVEYHPFLSQERVLKVLREEDIMLTAYCPLAKGKVLDDSTLKEIGSEYGKSPAQIALRWLMQQDLVVPIPRSSNPAHRESNFDIFDFELSNEAMDRIHNLAEGDRLINPEAAPEWEDGT